MSQAASPGLPLSRTFPWCTARRCLVRAALGLVAFLVIGNLVIQGVSLAARATVDTDRVPGVEHVDNLRAVDDTVWRGAAPTRDGYRDLADAGVTVTVDLRAETDAAANDRFIESVGMRVVHIPIRDGQTPSADDVQKFLAVVRNSDGHVFVHCGAGVGRAGAMVAAYVLATDQAGPGSALGRNLAVGPPSLEQIVYAGTGGGEPSIVTKAVSRTLDAPRRIWHSIL